MKKVIMKIEDVINQRLKMQSTQNLLEKEFGIKEFSKGTVVTFVTSDLKNLPENKQKRFILTLGGPANYKKTLSFIESL